MGHEQYENGPVGVERDGPHGLLRHRRRVGGCDDTVDPVALFWDPPITSPTPLNVSDAFATPFLLGQFEGLPAGDLDGDGLPDSTSAGTTILVGYTSAQEAGPHATVVLSSGPTFVDLDQDGYTDILGVAPLDTPILGITPTLHVLFGTGF